MNGNPLDGYRSQLPLRLYWFNYILVQVEVNYKTFADDNSGVRSCGVAALCREPVSVLQLVKSWLLTRSQTLPLQHRSHRDHCKQPNPGHSLHKFNATAITIVLQSHPGIKKAPDHYQPKRKTQVIATALVIYTIQNLFGDLALFTDIKHCIPTWHNHNKKRKKRQADKINVKQKFGLIERQKRAD